MMGLACFAVMMVKPMVTMFRIFPAHGNSSFGSNSIRINEAGKAFPDSSAFSLPGFVRSLLLACIHRPPTGGHSCDRL
jgi:hypothetical protein